MSIPMSPLSNGFVALHTFRGSQPSTYIFHTWVSAQNSEEFIKSCLNLTSTFCNNSRLGSSSANDGVSALCHASLSIRPSDLGSEVARPPGTVIALSKVFTEGETHVSHCKPSHALFLSAYTSKNGWAAESKR